jgi:hypothetical protein
MNVQYEHVQKAFVEWMKKEYPHSYDFAWAAIGELYRLPRSHVISPVDHSATVPVNQIEARAILSELLDADREVYLVARLVYELTGVEYSLLISNACHSDMWSESGQDFIKIRHRRGEVVRHLLKPDTAREIRGLINNRPERMPGRPADVGYGDRIFHIHPVTAHNKLKAVVAKLKRQRVLRHNLPRGSFRTLGLSTKDYNSQAPHFIDARVTA